MPWGGRSSQLGGGLAPLAAPELPGLPLISRYLRFNYFRTLYIYGRFLVAIRLEVWIMKIIRSFKSAEETMETAKKAALLGTVASLLALGEPGAALTTWNLFRALAGL